MKRNLAAFLVLISVLSAISGHASDWRELKSDHFVIFYTKNDGFSKDVASKSEIYYQRIASGLGYPRYTEFWTWDKRVKIYIHPDHKAYIKATKQPGWSHGMAEYNSKEIHSYDLGEGFLQSILPHEMAHLIFRDFVGFKGEVPLWLDEGVAQWAEEDKRRNMTELARKMYEDDTLLTLDDMMKLDPRNIVEKNRVFIRQAITKSGEKAPLILGAENLVATYYVLAVSLVDFLIEKFGSESFASFCRELRDGKSLEEALRRTYPPHIKNLADMETEWRKYLARN